MTYRPKKAFIAVRADQDCSLSSQIETSIKVIGEVQEYGLVDMGYVRYDGCGFSYNR